MISEIKDILSLSGERGKRMLLLVPVMLLASLLEMAGLAMVVSICSFLVNGGWAAESPLAVCFRVLFHTDDGKTMMIWTLAMMIGLYVFKLGYLSWESYIIAKFVRITRSEMSAALCRRIVRCPYSFFALHTTAEIQNLLGQDMLQFSLAMNACMQMAMEMLVVLGMGLYLLLLDPLMTAFVAAGIAVLLAVSRLILDRPTRRASMRQREANRKRWKWLHHITEGIKDIKVGRQEAFFEEHFADASAEYARSDYLRQFWTKLPGLCIETIMVLAVLAYLIFLVQNEKYLTDYFPGLTALAWTAIRFLPACNRINASLTQLNYARPSVDAIRAAMEKTAPEEGGSDGPQEEVGICRDIVLRQVTYAYDGSPEPVLRDVDVEIPAASAGIIGPSGAGKTTLLDILLGLLPPKQGEVLVDGVPIGRCRESYLKKVAYVPQNIFLLDDTIRSNVAMGEEPDQIDDARVWTALEQAALGRKVRGLPDGLDTQIGERGIRLSGGERQRLGLARAMYRDPAVIVFDEATSSLDLETEAAVLQSIFRLQGKKTLIIVSHRLSAIEHCSVIYRVHDGTVQRDSGIFHGEFTGESE